MFLLKYLLFPFSLLYHAVTRFRNHLYDIQYKKSFEFETFLINVGNLSVGGTGKTPHVEFLIRLLSGKYNIATLSRGYGRRTKGFRKANEEDNAKTIGDEPYQFYLKYGLVSDVYVGEERALAIPEILFHKEETDIILLDDAFQHRSVLPDINILLTDYHKPFFNDMVLPSGRLREGRKNAARADMVIVTKCPDSIGAEKMKMYTTKIRKYCSENTPVYFSGIRYMKPKAVFEDYSGDLKNVLLFSGIANDKPLKDYVQKNFNLLKYEKYPDHYIFRSSDIREIVKGFNELKVPDACILTTEKDMARLLSLGELADPLKNLPVFYLPIEIYFLKDADKIENEIISRIEKGLNK